MDVVFVGNSTASKLGRHYHQLEMVWLPAGIHSQTWRHYHHHQTTPHLLEFDLKLAGITKFTLNLKTLSLPSKDSSPAGIHSQTWRHYHQHWIAPHLLEFTLELEDITTTIKTHHLLEFTLELEDIVTTTSIKRILTCWNSLSNLKAPPPVAHIAEARLEKFLARASSMKAAISLVGKRM